MRSKKIIKNTATNLLLHITKILVGLIIPALLIKNYGSIVNGLTASITQFVGYITLMQAGVSSVITAALYKPLAEKNTVSISGIIKASEQFYIKLSFFMILYAGVLAIYFGFSSGEQGFTFSASLVAIISIGTIAQYMIGNTSRNLLTADQRQSVLNTIQFIIILLNAISTYILVNCGFGIQTVKLFSSMFFLLQPLLFKMYASKKYVLIKNIAPNTEAIKQRWSGVGHSVASYVHTKSDVFLITILMGYYHVSIYSVYAMIVSNIQMLILSLNNPITSAFGNMLVTGKNEDVLKKFKSYLFLYNILTMTLFIVAIILIIPFLRIYTNSFNDDNYIQPLLAYLLITAELLFCLRVPYACMISAAGHFKQTQLSAYIEALINIVLSLAMIRAFGLVGVTIGTIFAMLYRTIYIIFYLNNNIIKIKLRDSILRTIINIAVGAVLFILFNVIFNAHVSNYLQWAILAIPITIISALVVFATNAFFFNSDLKSVITIAKSFFKIKNPL